MQLNAVHSQPYRYTAARAPSAVAPPDAGAPPAAPPAAPTGALPAAPPAETTTGPPLLRLLPPATKLGQGYVLTCVCDSVHN